MAFSNIRIECIAISNADGLAFVREKGQLLFIRAPYQIWSRKKANEAILHLLPKSKFKSAKKLLIELLSVETIQTSRVLQKCTLLLLKKCNKLIEQSKATRSAECKFDQGLKWEDYLAEHFGAIDDFCTMDHSA